MIVFNLAFPPIAPLNLPQKKPLQTSAYAYPNLPLNLKPIPP